MRKRWAGDTWRSLAALVHDESGLPADQIGADLAPATRLAHTSPTNIGGYLWSVAAAYGLGLIDEREGIERCRRALHTLDRLERHEPTGMFFNWYAFDTGALITSWPGTGARVIPFLSSVDNAWLAVGLRVISSAFPKSQTRRTHCSPLRTSAPSTIPTPAPVRRRERSAVGSG